MSGFEWLHSRLVILLLVAAAAAVVAAVDFEFAVVQQLLNVLEYLC